MPLERSKPTRRFLDRVLRGLVWRRLEKLDHGRLVIDDGGQRREFGRSGEGSLAANIEIRDPRFYRHLVFGGSLGAAEAYIRGYWTCDDLVSLVRIFCRNAAVSTGMERGPARILSPLARIAHWLRRNTPSGSRRNIAAHYDLGNEFFSLFLDETMAYSCAIFPQAESTLHEASVAKFDRICRKLALTADDHVLEIGSGWGGFALHAATEVRLPRHHDHDLPQAIRIHPAAGGGGRPGRPRDRALRRLPGADGFVRQARLDRDDRGRGASVLRHLFPRLLASG